MTATTDTITISLALGTARALARMTPGLGKRGAVLRTLKESALQFDQGLDALRRIEETPILGQDQMAEAIRESLREMQDGGALKSFAEHVIFDTMTQLHERVVEVGGRIDLDILAFLVRKRLHEMKAGGA